MPLASSHCSTHSLASSHCSTLSSISILSFDCAIKNLAYARITIRGSRLGLESGPEALHETLRGVFTLETGLHNLIGARDIKDVTEIERVKLLAQFLSGIPGADYVLIERQPAMIGAKNNTVANAIACQIAYHYVAQGTASVHYVSPALKNGMALGGLASLVTTGTNAKKYSMRKKHAVENYKYFNRVFALGGPTTSKLDDIADAVMQALAFIRRHRLLRTQIN